MLITSKGQVTIPLKIRTECGFLPHTEVRFVLDENGRVFLEKIVSDGPSRGRQIVDSLRGSATVKLSTDQIMSHTKDDAE